MSRFQEYLDRKGNMQEKPIVDVDGDTADEPTVKPPKAVYKGKNWSTPDTKDGEDKPYSAKDMKEKGYSNSSEKGFGYTGDKRLKYEPKTTEEYAEKDPKRTTSFPNEKVSTPWEPNTEAFLKMTEDMSLSEFTNFLNKKMKLENLEDLPKVYAHKEGNITPDPLQAIKYVSFLTSNNKSLMETLVAELKSKGCLGEFVKETMNYSEGINKISEALKEERVCKRFVRSVVEMTDAPAAETETSLDKKEKKERKGPQKAKGRKTSSIEGEEMDMGNSDVVATKEKKMESALIKAFAENPITLKIMRKLVNEYRECIK